jgi:hypothetical protein
VTTGCEARLFARWREAAIGLSMLAASAVGALADAPPDKAAPSAEIPFVRQGEIDGWRFKDDNAVEIRTRLGRYYRATFASVCFKPIRVDRIEFAPTAGDTIDRHSAVMMNGHRCFFDNFAEIPEPADW